MHKLPIPDKIPPVVSDVESESYAISKFIDYHLAPFVTTHPSYVKNYYEFLYIYIYLYTNIDNEMGIRAVSEAFATNPKPIHKCIIKLLRLSLEGNDFAFNGKHYLQISVMAMGKKIAPHYADITMAYCMGPWEVQNLPKCIILKLKIYLRYLDNIFMIWVHKKILMIFFRH